MLNHQLYIDWLISDEAKELINKNITFDDLINNNNNQFNIIGKGEKLSINLIHSLKFAYRF